LLAVASKYRIVLSEVEERELRRRAGQYTRSHREVLRAKIVLLAATSRTPSTGSPPMNNSAPPPNRTSGDTH
jgi:hypothetical protein